MRRPDEHPDDLLTAKEAAAILSKNAGHTVSANYVRVLASQYGKLEAIPLDGRTNLYRRGQVEALRIGTKPGSGKKKKTDDTKKPA